MYLSTVRARRVRMQTGDLPGASAGPRAEARRVTTLPAHDRAPEGDPRWAGARERLGERLGPVGCGRVDPAREWEIVEQRFPTDALAATESIFAVGNGYLGLRGAPEEVLRRTTPAPSSTASTRPGRSSTPRTRTVSRAPARRSSTRPIRRPSACLSR